MGEKMNEQVTPTSAELKFRLDNGATAQDIDEMFYPGERHKHNLRKEKYPIPEGTGRRNPSSYDMKWVREFKHNQFTVGIRERDLLYIDDIYIGHIDEIRRGMCDIYYRTHDGEDFAHWGGSTGAEPYLIDRYWLYGNPPEKKYKSKHPTYGEFVKKVKSGEINIEMLPYKAECEWRFKTHTPWIKLTEERIEKEALDMAYYEYIEKKNEEIKVNNSVFSVIGLLVIGVLVFVLW